MSIGKDSFELKKMFERGPTPGDDFMDAQAMARETPDTFEAPGTNELNSIKPGSLVKVCDGQERFWVIVRGVKGNTISGEVDNELLGGQYALGELISFEKRNVYQVWDDTNEAIAAPEAPTKPATKPTTKPGEPKPLPRSPMAPKPGTTPMPKPKANKDVDLFLKKRGLK